MVYNIIEVANTHNGNIGYIYNLLDEFKSLNGDIGVKFQAFKYDEIATKDHDWFETYKTFYFNPDEWKKIINTANETKDVWLDIFDKYGVLILEQNIDVIKGFKLQSSVLFNKIVLKKLSCLNLADISVIINIAAHEISEIKSILNNIENFIKPKEIILEVGFQDFPTELADAGISKIRVLKELFSNKIAFADHVDGTSQEAIELPIIASLVGADVIEKHIMHSTLETKYDDFSSVTFEAYSTYIDKLHKYDSLLKEPFINDREREYLEKTIQIPIALEKIPKGTLISDDELSYKRSGKTGLNTQELEELQQNYYILNNDKEEEDTFHKDDFKKAKIASIIACRLKSTRLPKKAILPIGNISSIEMCIKNALNFKNVDYTILATSDNEQDAELENYTYSDEVIFHTGDPDNVISRYLSIVKKLGIDVIVRFTGDCPYISKEIFELLLESHFKEGADYTASLGAPVGTYMEIINRSALEKVSHFFPNAEYSEYMTWYFQNNPEHFKINLVEVPDKWCRDYRLTLDYQEDLDLFNCIENYFVENNLEFTLDELFYYLDNNPDIANINMKMPLKYKTDEKLIETLNKCTKIN